ncbi:phage terminase large subunit family protein [Intestinibacillus massiliensis]
MRTYKQRKYQVPPYILGAMQHLRPPEDIKVSEWAERHRILGEKSCAMPGPWRNIKTPYLVGFMDALNDYEVEEVAFVKPTQVGGTESLQNMVGYVISQDPSPTMIVYPTDKLAESVSENRLVPMVKDSPTLDERFRETNSSKLELQFDSMYIVLCGANSPSSLASRPIRFLFLDEVDKYPAASKKEADPISLARERTKTFPNRKICMCSTPTLRTGPIWKALESADKELHYFVPCPHCAERIELKFAQLKWPKESDMSNRERAEQACYVCQSCGCVINDADKARMLRQGTWRAVRENATAPNTKVAFWLNTLYSPFVRFSEVAFEFLNSKDDPEKLQNFVNSWLAEPWEDTALKTSADTVLARQTCLPALVVPGWARLLTGGVDVQETCFYWTIRAWGDAMTSQCIAHGQALSWGAVDRQMDLEYRKEDGTAMLVDLCLVDSGDQTEDVYDFCATREWALPCKGVSGSYSHYRISTVNRTGSKGHGMQLVLVDGGKYKDMIAARMRKENGQGSWMVHADCDREYAEQVTAEHKVRDKNGKLAWALKSSHADNHYLDCEVYAAAAADVLEVRSLFLQETDEPDSTAPQSISQPPQAPEIDWLGTGGDWLGG